MTDADSTLLDAFRRARISAQSHMTRSEAQGLSWNEETITDLVLVDAAPLVTAIPFTKREEGGPSGTGADWLWWWIGDDGECFGTLVQAKRLKKGASGRWRIDFGYKPKVYLT